MERKDPSGPRPIADVLRHFLKESGLRRSSGDDRVFQAWTEAAGAEWNRRSWPAAFRAGELVVEVQSPQFLAELKGFHGEGFRARANAALGEMRIRKVVFKLKS